MKPIAFGSALLLSTALCAPAAWAQSGPSAGQVSPPSSPAGGVTPPGTEAGAPASSDTAEEQVEISTPGADATTEIVVTGRYIPQPVRSTPQVVSVLSTADIARTGEGDIAGALGRLPGLSVVGNGFVYVRGLGDRYSLALLNGLQLPSPEPLRRAIPLDIFPTSVVASAVVQKSYSANFPGEFGGGVVNLTTPAVPAENFLNIGIGGSVDVETTAKLGYTYEGGDLDWLGFDDGTRKVPAGIRAATTGGGRPLTTANYTARQLQDITASLNNAETTLLQRNRDIPANFSADMNFGFHKEVGSDAEFGIFGSASYGNTFRTRDIRQQVSTSVDLSSLVSDFKTIITDQRTVVSGLLGMGLNFGDNKIRWTNLFIRDTVKQGRLSAGYDTSVTGADPVPNPDFTGTPPILVQNTFWFARQLFDTQAVGEFKFDDLSVDVRGGYANTKRKSPYEREFLYVYNPTVRDYTNNLSGGGGSASVAFSDLNEDAYSGGIDFGYKLPTERPITLSAGYAFNKNERTSSRYDFAYRTVSGASLPSAVAQERPDYLTSDYNVYTYGVSLVDQSGFAGSAAYDASLRVHAGYGQIIAEPTDGVRITAGVRYEDARQIVTPLGDDLPTRLSKSYWLPAGTITWNFMDDAQLRLSASKTIARPQFRELARQIFQDFESDRSFTGNPLLTDTQLYNGEARLEYYPGRNEILSIGGFYKRLKNPIEQLAFVIGGGGLRTSFSNAPEADLYGGEVEATKFFTIGESGFFTSRRLRVSANYTYTQSKVKADDSLVINPIDLNPIAASTLFRNGSPLTGQSDHLANGQIGFESSDHLSQQTLLVNYASPRVTNRGPVQDGRTPDIKEKPGITLDLVLREEAQFLGLPVEFKAEGRNLLNRKYKEYQANGERRVDVNRYQLGRVFSLSATAKF
ncbi:TonB-dependent receptor domain-containing protein [Sphingomonas jatrophae]|uniref:Outer membrane receptor proteins, mostly Fe transport n=1 Tax=Sphingomonas jatrophae TaxID=1166337 RepID=A0A1I6JCY8_9SPHN|nr:TonB-dependent receptor [Sphingomonas jatrophae]SFR76821.1 Outer membrane receptor proteins, mostly Fe transport [Sphingomonas jatrophae]